MSMSDSNQAGYTTLEAAIAAVLLTAVLVPLAAFGVYLAGDRSAMRRARALSEAERRLEQMMASPVVGRDSSRAPGLRLRWRGWYEGDLYVAEVEASDTRRAGHAVRLRSAVLDRR